MTSETRKNKIRSLCTGLSIKEISEILNEEPSFKVYNGISKVIARQRTIRAVIDDVFGGKIPREMSYITLAGSAVLLNKSFNPDSEAGQLTREKSIVPRQFFGIDKEPQIIAENQKAAPQFNWIEGDINSYLERRSSDRKKFLPAFVNFDTEVMAKNAAIEFARGIRILTGFENPMAILLNVITKNPHCDIRQTVPEAINDLCKMPWFDYLFQNWDVRDPLLYNGTNGRNIEMCSFIFVQK